MYTYNVKRPEKATAPNRLISIYATKDGGGGPCQTLGLV